MKSIVIYNKFASIEKAEKRIVPIKESFRKHNIEAKFFFAENAQLAFQFISDTDLTQFDNIISVGGDGTLFQVVNASMAKAPEERRPIGVIPLGTGNAFCRDLGLKPNDYELAVKAIKQGVTKQVDVGVFRTGEHNLYFSNILGLGFVTDVAKTANKLKLLGKISYTLGVLYHVIFLKPFDVTIEYDGKKVEREVIFVEVSNTRYTGSDFIMAPNAIINDGLLDVTILLNTSRSKILRSLPKIFTGTHIHIKEIETFRAKQLKITTEQPKTLTTDGEIIGATPIDINCLPKELDFIINDV